MPVLRQVDIKIYEEKIGQSGDNFPSSHITNNAFTVLA